MRRRARAGDAKEYPLPFLFLRIYEINARSGMAISSIIHTHEYVAWPWKSGGRTSNWTANEDIDDDDSGKRSNKSGDPVTDCIARRWWGMPYSVQRDPLMLKSPMNPPLHTGQNSKAVLCIVTISDQPQTNAFTNNQLSLYSNMRSYPAVYEGIRVRSVR